MLLTRSYQKEIMDDFSIHDARIEDALKELKIINKFLGGNSTTKSGLKKLLQKDKNSELSILDVGGGSSDIFFSINNKKNYKVFNVDINKGINKYVKKNSRKIITVCADFLNSPFKEKSYDIVHTSLFLHHFHEEEIKIILIKMKNLAKKGIIINDLQRSVFALTGIKILTQLFSKSKMVKNDAPLSVEKGFTKSELKKILNDLNLDFEIKWKWAFRWLIVIYC